MADLVIKIRAGVHQCGTYGEPFLDAQAGGRNGRSAGSYRRRFRRLGGS